MSNRIPPEKIAELRAQVDDNMADAEVGPLLDEIERLEADSKTTECVYCGKSFPLDTVTGEEREAAWAGYLQIRKDIRRLSDDGEKEKLMEKAIALQGKYNFNLNRRQTDALEAESLMLKKQIAELKYQQEADTVTVGILADVVDVLWQDDTRSEKHGCSGVVAKAREVVMIKERKA